MPKITQQCQLKAALLEFDISAHPNIDFIAGNRLSVYPMNPADHVSAILKHIQDDIFIEDSKQQNRLKRVKLSDPWAKFVQSNGKQSIRLALTYIYDIRSPPSRELLRVMADCCTNKDHKIKLIALSKSDDVWEKWVCQTLRTLKSTLDEFSSCMISAKSLFSELTIQQPRQYSISSIKSTKRFRAEILVAQHKFTARQIAATMTVLKERNLDETAGVQAVDLQQARADQMKTHPLRASVHDDGTQTRSSASIRSIRSIATFGVSPISNQQVKQVPHFSGPLMSLYASSTSGLAAGTSKASEHSMKERNSQIASAHRNSGLGSIISSAGRQFEGLCSNYLLGLNPNDMIMCEFVENPRFTLKGNRERPIMMIGQEIGLVAFRPFWQQRSLEHDRAQMFYTLFKDLSPKKFGDMHLVCLTGGKCKFEETFKKEIQQVLTHRILTSTQNVQCKHLVNLLDNTASLTDTNVTSPNFSQTSMTSVNEKEYSSRVNQHGGQPINMPKELLELGKKMAKLLIENNGCIYTCCDPHLTQALEILVVESVSRQYNKTLTRSQVMTLLPRWKGKRIEPKKPTSGSVNTNKFLFMLENPFENAQIVQEIYDSTI